MFPHLLEARMVRQPVIYLFSGVGALDLGLSELIQSIVYVEKDGFCQQVLQARMHDGLLDAAAIASDVPSSKIASLADGLTAGFPCQGVSKAGHQLGLNDDRTSLIKHVFRIMDLLIRLRFVLLENVNALLSGKRAMHAMGRMLDYASTENTSSCTQPGHPFHLEGIWITPVRGLIHHGYYLLTNWDDPPRRGPMTWICLWWLFIFHHGLFGIFFVACYWC